MTTTWLFPVSIVEIAATLVLAFVYFYLYHQDRQRFLLVWAVAWAVYLVRFCFMALSILAGESVVLDLGYHLSALGSGLLLFLGTHLFLGRKVPRLWLGVSLVISIFVVFAVLTSQPFWILSLPTFLFLSLIYIWTGTVFLRSTDFAGGSRRLVGWTFILWGLHKADYPLLRPLAWFAPWGYVLSAVIELTVALGMLLVYFQKMKRGLQESERKFRLFVENAQDIIFRYRLLPERAFEYVSPSVTRLTGYTPEEHYEDPELGFRIIHPDDRELLRGVTDTTGRTSPLVVRWLRKDGSVLWTEQVIAPVLDKDGRLVAIEGIARDVTARTEAELAAAEQEKRFRDFLESIRLLAVMLDLEGRIIFANAWLLEVTGWKREDVLGKDWFSLFLRPDTGGPLREKFQALVPAGAFPQHYENPIITKTGGELLITWNNTVLHNSFGRVIGSASIGVDITEHRKLEDQLRQAQKMEAVGQLAGGVAHDFNNVLSAIVGYGNLLKMKMDAGDPRMTDLDRILAASEKAAQLTHSLLAFSRKQVINPKSLDLNSVIDDAAKLLARVIGEDVELRLFPAGEPLNVMADSGLIQQVLMNLATNARDAMPDGGRLEIAAHRMVMDEAFVRTHGFGRPGDYGVVAVSDTGIGMDDQTLRRIFEPFFTTKELGRGTGLGLAMVYGIVKQHGGFVDVRSQPGKGTTFRMYLPLILQSGTRKHADALAAADSALPRGSETLLVAEDDEMVRTLTVSVLREFGYHVVEAGDGEEAVRKFADRADDVRLVVLDVIMPRMNGKEALKQMRELRPGLLAIFLSGYTADIIEKKGIDEEGVDLIRKPVTPADLLRKVREVLDRGDQRA